MEVNGGTTEVHGASWKLTENNGGTLHFLLSRSITDHHGG